MRTIELARKLAELGQKADAQNGYYLALQENKDLTPNEELEAASYLFFSQWDYKLPFTIFISLYNRGEFQAELMNLILQGFYFPNVQKQQKRYERNCRALSRYSYFFRKEFPKFEDLPVLFVPYDDKSYIPYSKAENRFGEYVNFNDPVIDRYFFKDLENPILAKDVYSQYQLEYLNDSVRKSEWVGRENHIYLHYTNWMQFCAHLQCLDFVPLLKEEKFVLLLEEEGARYPIDFQKEFGIDYSKYPPKPVGIREVNRLIWHTQLSAHNGGDFFNEIFYDHPNLLVYESVMFDNVLDNIKKQRRELKKYIPEIHGKSRIVRELVSLPNLTDKDLLVAMFLSNSNVSGDGLNNARIAPALFFQPHFSNITYRPSLNQTQDKAILESKQYEEIRQSPLFQQFKYIKTFSPMRRPTTSYGATIRFMLDCARKSTEDAAVSDIFTDRLLNRSFMVDKWDRLYRDSALVRFEDGKLNPKATFTALAEFLDIPYTESMTYCSGKTGLNPVSMKGNVLGFDTAAIYRTYDDYTNDDDRCLLEYFLQDVYREYGYDFHYYHGESVDLEWIQEKLKGFEHLDCFIRETVQKVLERRLKGGVIVHGDQTFQGEDGIRLALEKKMADCQSNRLRVTELLYKHLEFVNPQAQPLRFMKKLELDPALLEQPLYH